MHVRGANVWERHELSRLAFRSKAHWGYSPEFMAACRDELGVSHRFVPARRTWVKKRAGFSGFIPSMLALIRRSS